MRYGITIYLIQDLSVISLLFTSFNQFIHSFMPRLSIINRIHVDQSLMSMEKHFAFLFTTLLPSTRPSYSNFFPLSSRFSQTLFSCYFLLLANPDRLCFDFLSTHCKKNATIFCIIQVGPV